MHSISSKAWAGTRVSQCFPPQQNTIANLQEIGQNPGFWSSMNTTFKNAHSEDKLTNELCMGMEGGVWGLMVLRVGDLETDGWQAATGVVSVTRKIKSISSATGSKHSPQSNYIFTKRWHQWCYPFYTPPLAESYFIIWAKNGEIPCTQIS